MSAAHILLLGRRLAVVSVSFTRRAGKGRRIYPSLDAFLQEEQDWINEIVQWHSSPSAGEQPTDRDWSQRRLALVFGREESGLTDEEVALCSYAIGIPSNPEFPSLNLSHAVAVVLSRLYSWALALDDANISKSMGGVLDGRPHEHPASHAEVDALLDKVNQMLCSIGIVVPESIGGGDRGNHGRKRQSTGHLRSIFQKSKATTAEIRSLFGLLKEVEEKMSHDLDSSSRE